MVTSVAQFLHLTPQMYIKTKWSVSLKSSIQIFIQINGNIHQLLNSIKSRDCVVTESCAILELHKWK